jgi:hypothetical protein
VWWARGARDCLELPAGVLDAATRPGDELAIADLAVRSE